MAGSLSSVKSAQAAEGELLPVVVEVCSGVGDLPAVLRGDFFLRTSSRRCEGMYLAEAEDEERRDLQGSVVFKGGRGGCPDSRDWLSRFDS